MPNKKKRLEKKINRREAIRKEAEQGQYPISAQENQQFFQQQINQPPQSIPKYQQPNQNLLFNSPTGVAELDKLIGGGFPKGSVVMLAGSSGSGKTILSFQWLFEGVKNHENGVYITLTEPLFKSLKNLETMNFYDKNAIEQQLIKIVDIREIYEKKGADQQKILSFIEEQVRQTNAKRLCIDSITAIAYNLNDKAQIRRFIFELGKILATLGCTTVLTSEVTEANKFSVYEVEEFISDAILRFDQVKVKDELHRLINIIKVRGRGYKAEDLYFKISENGIVIFPRLKVPLSYASTTEKTSTGNDMLDKMLLGGILRGSATLLAGSTGAGKSLLCMQFVMEGLRKGEPCLYAGFEESKEQIIRNAEGFGWNFRDYEKKGLLVMRSVYPSEKSLEEHLSDIKQIVESRKIKRCAVDSLSSVSHSFPEDIFINFAHRLNGYLKTQTVTTFLTAATAALIGATTLTESHLSTMTDNIIMLRYAEMEGELNRVLNIVKVRGSSHSKGLRKYDITSKGILIGQSLSGYEGIMTGTTRKVSETIEERLQSEFKKFIGPMAASIFAELKDKELTKANIFSFIDGLVNEGILRKEDANVFKQNVTAIVGTSVSDEFEQSKSIEQEAPMSVKQMMAKEIVNDKAGDKKGFFAGLFGKLK